MQISLHYVQLCFYTEVRAALGFVGRELWDLEGLFLINILFHTKPNHFMNANSNG